MLWKIQWKLPPKKSHFVWIYCTLSSWCCQNVTHTIQQLFKGSLHPRPAPVNDGWLHVHWPSKLIRRNVSALWSPPRLLVGGEAEELGVHLYKHSRTQVHYRRSDEPSARVLFQGCQLLDSCCGLLIISPGGWHWKKDVSTLRKSICSISCKWTMNIYIYSIYN